MCVCSGAYFHLSDSDDAAAEYLCKLSTDHRQILISQDHLPIAMRHILEVKTLHGEGMAVHHCMSQAKGLYSCECQA